VGKRVMARRVSSMLMTATLLAGVPAGIAAAGNTEPSGNAGPASDVLLPDFAFGDETAETVVLAVYPDGPSPLRLDALRVVGPQVGWLQDHPLPTGAVKWRVIVESAPTRDGPWTVETKSRHRFINPDQVDPLETFKDRTVGWKDRSGKRFARLISKITWVNEDGGTITSVRHEYTSYGLAVKAGSMPAFGDEEATRKVAPNIGRR
jgi:hypothetical protein